MATRLAMAENRAESIETANEAVKQITEQINAFLGEGDQLEAFVLTLQMPKNGDPFLRESKQIGMIATYLSGVNTRLGTLTARIKDQEELVESLLETKSSLLDQVDELTKRVTELESEPEIGAASTEPIKVDHVTKAAKSKAK